MEVNPENISSMIQKKRGGRGIREVAQEIGISSATLSRIVNGKLPDINTFAKLCQWLDVPADEMLGVPSKNVSEHQKFSVHFKADKNLSSKAANALAQLILAAQSTFGNEKC